MTVLHLTRRFAQRALKVDVSRYPQSDPLYRTVRLMMRVGVSTVLDVGANTGGYAISLRRLGYCGRIVSFEPTRRAFQDLRDAAEADARWEACPIALGNQDGYVEIHVAGNQAASSSVLKMLNRHLEAQPDSAYTHTEEVPIRRLDSVVPELCSGEESPFLKLDVQGAEASVLDGSASSLRLFLGVQAEMNLVPLYDGQIAYRDLIDRLVAEGFTLVDIIPGFTDAATGQLLAADGVFMRMGSLGHIAQNHTPPSLQSPPR